MLSFERIGKSFLFKLPSVGSAGASPGVIAYLYPSTGKPPERDLPLSDAWRDVKGYFLFLEALPDSASIDEFINKMQDLLPAVSHASLAWVVGDANEPDKLSVQNLGLKPDTQGDAVIDGSTGTSLNFNQFVLFFAQAVPVALKGADDSNAPYFVFTNNQDQSIRLAPQPGPGGKNLTETRLPLTGETLGYQLFSTSFDSENISAANFDFSCRYFVPSQNGGAARSLRYPVVDLSQGASLALDVRLNPVFASESYFLIDTKATPTLASFFRTVDGRAVSLTPRAGARLYLSQKTRSNSAAHFAYLVPEGTFDLSLDETQAGVGEDDTPLQLLCGLAGTETISFTPSKGGVEGDVLAFFRGQAAYAPGFGQSGSEGAALLTSDFTTSWAAIGPADGALTDTHGNQYLAQPDGASLYSLSTPVDTQASTPQFLGFLQIPSANLGAPSVSQSYPMVALAGAQPERESDVEASDYAALEQGVVSPSRKARILGFTDLAKSTGTFSALESVSGTTAQGLIAQLPGQSAATAGAIPQWQQLDLAKNLDDDLQQLKTLKVVTPTPEFQNALQTSKLFLVITKNGLMGDFLKEISIGGWPFDIDIGFSAGPVDPPEGEIDNVLIFKFFDEKLETLVDNLGGWAQADHFTGKEGNKVQTFLKAFFKEARDKAASNPELYGPFVEQVLDRPTWNGILALNVKIPLTQLPEEVRGLLGGIKKPELFKVHHFGIEINKTDPSGASQEKSSLFALIDYEDDGSEGGLQLDAAEEASPYDFTVKTLQLLFANTEIKEFKSRILVTMNELFDEKASLEPAEGTAEQQSEDPPNSIELQGSYEKHETEDGGSQSTYTFIYEGKKLFKIDSEVMKSVQIDKVQFTTVSTSTEGETATLRSQFAFWGNVAFGSLADFDFFSFDSLGFADLQLGMQFQVKDGRVVEGSRKFLFDPGNLRFNVSFSKTRQDSLLGNFPLRLTGFVFNTREGQSVNDLGFIKVPDLIPGITPTDKPLYALTLSLSLGSAGSLVSKNEGFAIEVLAGWTPSGGSGKNAFAFGIKLPESGGGGTEIGIQGVLTLSVKDFGFAKLPDNPKEGEPFVYALYLNTAILKILGTQIPPGGSFSTLLFVPFQKSTRPDLSNLGWFVAYEPTPPPSLTSSEAKAGLIDVRDDHALVSAEEEPSKVLQLDYLGLGQRIVLDTSDADTVVAVIDKMKDLIPANKEGEALRKQLASLYSPDAGWLIGADFTLFQVMRLAVVFAEGPNVYGLLVGFVDKAPEVLKGFQFQILYKKINDSVGVYKIVLELPDYLRSQQFGAVGFTLPTIKIDIFTNGDFKLDIGFPQGLDFSNSFCVQAQAGPIPVIGYGGFFFAKLSSATSSTVPEIPPEVGQFAPVLEAGFGLSLGVGKTIEKGIFRAGLTVSFVGILEGTVAWFNPAGSALLPVKTSAQDGALAALASLAPAFNRAPDFYRVKGQFAIVGKLYGEVDFGIVKAGVNLTIWASVTVTFAAFETLDLEIAAGVSVKVTIVIGSFKIFGARIEIKISFSFSTRISYTFSIEDNRTPPWGRRPGVAALAVDENLLPLSWTVSQVVQSKPQISFYFSPQVTVAQSEGQQYAQAVASLSVENTQGKAYFDTLLSVFLRWTLVLGEAPATVDKDFLETLLQRLDLPVTLARTPAPLTALDYPTLAAFLAKNFNPVSIQAPPSETADGVATNEAGMAQTSAMAFPMIPDLGANFDDTPVSFWLKALRSVQYQEDLAEYFAQLLVNFDAKGDAANLRLMQDAQVSIATTLFEDYFALIIKAGIGQAIDYVDVHGAQSVDELLSGLAKSEGDKPSALSNVGAQASRFLLHGLQVPAQFPYQIGDALSPLYVLDGQQCPIKLQKDKAWVLSLFANEKPAAKWFTLAGGEQAPTLTISADANDPGRKMVQTLEKAKVSVGSISQMQISNLLARPQEYAFQNAVAWSPKGVSGPSLWPYPAGLSDRLAMQRESGDTTLGVVLNQTQEGSTPTALAVPAAGTDYRWSLQVSLTARQVPLSGGASGHLPKTYQLGGTDEATRGLLQDLLAQLALGDASKPQVEGFSILYRPQQGSGLISADVDGAKVLLLKTNLSTESAPPTAAFTAQSALPPADRFSALMVPEQAEEFLRLIFQVSIVNAGGFYLYYEDSAEKGLPDYLFSGTSAADLSLLVTFKTQSQAIQATNFLNGESYTITVDEVGSYGNTLTVLSTASDQHILYAQAPTIPAYRPAIANGSVGFMLERDDPETALQAPASLTGQLGASQGFTRDQIATAIIQAGHDPAAESFRSLMREAGDDAAQLSNLFNLLTYGIDDNTGFGKSIRGLPIGPTEEADQNAQGKWRYRQVIPIYPSAKQPLPVIGGDDLNPYSGVGSDVLIGLDLLDLFGNPIITDKPLLPLTAKALYFDPLIGLESWPAVSASYVVSPANDVGTLSATLSFTKSAFLDDNGKVDKSQVRNAIDTYIQAGNQMLAPGYSACLSSSVAPDIKSSDQSTALKGFIKDILAYLTGLLGSEAVRVDGKLSATLSYTLSAEQRNQQQTQNIYEVILELVLERSAYVDPDTRDTLPSATRVSSSIAPFTDSDAGADGQKQAMALTSFAKGFEAAFPELKATTGTGSMGDSSVFAVRMGKILDGAPGISYAFEPDSVLYYAPPPLSNTLLSRDININFADGELFTRNIAGVDMDVWGADFLAAVDIFLQPQSAVAARQVDPAAFTTVATAKETLAQAIGSAVTPVLAAQTPGADALKEAQKAFRQRLLVTLSSAYDVATVVQFKAKVTVVQFKANVSRGNANNPPPNLYGEVSAVAPAQVMKADTTPDFSLTPSKVALGNGDSRLNTLFSVQTPKEQSHVPLDMSYCVTHVEHDIMAAQQEDQFQPSHWLTLILPEPAKKMGSADIPVALREYPVPPTLASQAAIAQVLARCAKTQGGSDDPLQIAKRWQYRFTYTQAVVAQDSILPDVKFNVGPGVPNLTLAAPVPDLLDWLARFQSEYPELLANLREHDAQAIAQFAILVDGVAGTWGAWVNKQAAGAQALNSAALGELSQVTYRYRVEELVDKRQIQVQWLAPVPAQTPASFPWIELSVDDDKPQCLEPTIDQHTQTALYTYKGTQSGDTLSRTLIFPDLDVLNTENGWGGIQLARNEVLYPQDMTIQTNPAFKYQTPMVRFVNKKTPLIDVGAALDIGAEVSEPQALKLILSQFLQALFEGAGTGMAAINADPDGTRTLQMNCRYGYDIQGKAGAAQGPDKDASFITYLPLLSRPPFTFTLGSDWNPDDPTSFVCLLAQAIEQWQMREQPSDSRAFLLFDMSVFASLSDIQLPVLRLRKLWLGMEKISSS